MDHTYWLRQSADKPLFPDLLWSRPETKATAGKLAIIGGNVHGFAAVAEAFNEARKAGIGAARVLLPDSLQKTVSRLFPEAEFAPSTPSGSFSQQALAGWLEISHWADGVLIAGDLGRNSETAIVIEQFLEKFGGQLTLAGDCLDYFSHRSHNLLGRDNTLIAPQLNQLQKIMTASGLPYSLATSQQFVQQIETLHQLTDQYNLCVISQLGEQAVVAVKGQIGTMPKSGAPLSLATNAAVWWLQNPAKTFEAIASSLIDLVD